jgi:hypothetical protein
MKEQAIKDVIIKSRKLRKKHSYQYSEPSADAPRLRLARIRTVVVLADRTTHTESVIRWHSAGQDAWPCDCRTARKYSSRAGLCWPAMTVTDHVTWVMPLTDWAAGSLQPEGLAMAARQVRRCTAGGWRCRRAPFFEYTGCARAAGPLHGGCRLGVPGRRVHFSELRDLGSSLGVGS